MSEELVQGFDHLFGPTAGKGEEEVATVTGYDHLFPQENKPAASQSPFKQSNFSDDIPFVPESGDISELARSDPMAHAFKSDPDMVTRAILETGGKGLIELAASINRGNIALADLPANVANMVSTYANMGLDKVEDGFEAVGHEVDIPKIPPMFTIAGTEFGQKSMKSQMTADDRSTDSGGLVRKSFALDTLNKGMEFYSGGRVFTELFKRAGAAKPETLQSGVGEMISSQIAKTTNSQEAAAAAGAGFFGSIAEEITENPMVKMGFELVGAVFGGAAEGTKSGKLLSATQRKGAAIIQAGAANKEQALADLITAREHLIGSEATGDVGIMHVHQSLARADHALEQRYRQYIDSVQDQAQREVEDALGGPFGDVKESVFQDMVVQHRDVILDGIEARFKQADQQIDQIASLSGRSVDDVAESIRMFETKELAIIDVDKQAFKLWQLVDNNVQVNNAFLRQEAADIVTGLQKASNPSKATIDALEMVLGKKIIKTGDGWAVGTEEVVMRLNWTEKASQLSAAKSSFGFSKRAARSGVSKDFAAQDAAIFARLEKVAFDTLTDAKLVGKEYSSSYQLAHDFTSRSKLLMKEMNMDVNGVPEKFGKTLLGGGREQVAAGARQVDEITGMHKEVDVEIRKESGTDADAFKAASAKYVLTGFQRAMRDTEDKLGAAGKWLEDNQTGLKRFPQVEAKVRSTIATLEAAEGRRVLIESDKAIAEADAYFKIAGMNGRETVTHIKNDGHSKDLLENILKKLDGDFGGEKLARAGLKRDISEIAIEKMFPPSGNVTHASSAKILDDLDLFLSSRLYTDAERKVFKQNLKEMKIRVDLLKTKPQGEVVKSNWMNNMLGAMAGSKLVSMAGLGSGSIILHGRAASLGKKIFSETPDSLVEQILVEAMMNQKLMKFLLEADLNKVSSQEVIGVIAMVNAEYAQELSKKHAEPVKKTPIKKRVMKIMDTVL